MAEFLVFPRLFIYLYLSYGKRMVEKILICAPTAAAKNYCAENWLLTLNRFKYQNFEVVVFDNTNDGGANANYLNHLAEQLCVNYSFQAIHVDAGPHMNLHERLNVSHNACVLHALKNGFKHMLHLETDVMPEEDVIERLLFHRKKVVGALYYRDEGKSRKLMIQKHIYRAYNNIMAVNIGPQDDVCFVNGTLKKVAHVGLGCVLINTSIFKNFTFRFKVGIDAAPDTYFAEDCFRFGIDIWADTSLVCEHQNVAWGNYGVDYN